MTAELSVEQKNAVSRISGLILINAMIFQEILSDSDDRVLSLQNILQADNLQGTLSDHWKYIVKEIDYYPIFNIANEILINISSSRDFIQALQVLAGTAQKIVGMRAALRHDLVGRVYHRLLAEKKYLGTYYTSIPAATLLLKLALSGEAESGLFKDMEAVSRMRIGDLACGTGTLLMAAADAITDNYVSRGVENDRQINFSEIQNVLAEKVIFGYDILASAIQLTASTLALRAPNIAFNNMNLYSLPLGGNHLRLGSIEFLEEGQVELPLDQFHTKQINGKGVSISPAAYLPQMDICVMNPPFTRSVGGNLLFGSSPPEERARMQSKLKKIVQSRNVAASITAGLGSVFVAVADPYIKQKGILALVLPKAVLSGVAWEKTRELLRKKYQLRYIICSQDPLRWNFSESTSLSEVLLIASKTNCEAANPEAKVTAVNLWKNPTTSFEALAIANEVAKSRPPDITEGQGAHEIFIGKSKVGEALTINWQQLRPQDIWSIPSAFAQSDLIRVGIHLVSGQMWLPGRGIVSKLRLCALGEIADLGPDGRDIHDGFKISNTPTPFPSFWGHDSETLIAMNQTPNCFLSPLSKAKAGRKLRRAEDLWPHAGRLLLPAVMRLNTQKLISVRINKAVLSNVWWTLRLQDHKNSAKKEKALTFWLNSTLGILLLLVSKVETEGAWVKFKKPILSRMSILDINRLSSSSLSKIIESYDRLCNEPLQPFPEMASDPVRAEIDRAIAKALKLPDFSVIRELLAQEPFICLRSL